MSRPAANLLGRSPTLARPRTFTLPDVGDPIVTAMRPAFAAHVLVSQDGDGDATSIFDGITKAVDRQQSVMAIKSKNAPGPESWVCVGVKPGTYSPNITDALAAGTNSLKGGYVPPFIMVVALSPDRGATTLEWGLSPHNGCHYWEGVDLRVPRTGAWEPKYPIHLTNDQTNIFTRMKMSTLNSASSGGGMTNIGTDGQNGGCVVLHDIDLTDGGGTNQHGWPNLTVPSTCVYSKVRTRPEFGLNFGDNNGIETDAWFVDCTTGSVTLSANAGHMHVNDCGSATVHHEPVKGDGYAWDGTMPGTLDDRRDWPVPTGGLSDYWRAQIGATT